MSEDNRKKEVLNLASAWKCLACKKILGYTDNDKQILRIKYKDLYIYVKGGQVTEICRFCGKMNVVVSDEK